MMSLCKKPRLFTLTGLLALAAALPVGAQEPAGPAPAAAQEEGTSLPAMQPVYASRAGSLHLGISIGPAIDIMARGQQLAPVGAYAGEGGLSKALNNATRAGELDLFGSGSTASGSGEGTSTGLSGGALKLHADWYASDRFFLRGGVNIAAALPAVYSARRTYKLKTTGIGLSNDLSITDTARLEVNAAQLEVPLQIGFDFPLGRRGSFFIAAGAAYNHGFYKALLTADNKGGREAAARLDAASATLGASGTSLVNGRSSLNSSTADSIADVEAALSSGSIGLLYSFGTRWFFSERWAFTTEVRFFHGAVLTSDISGTKRSSGGTYASDSNFGSDLASAGGNGDFQISPRQSDKNGLFEKNDRAADGTDLSYVRFFVGVVTVL